MPDHALIRSARPDDLAALPLIERAAAAQLRTTPYAYLADDDLVSAEVNLAQEYVWVAVDQADQPIGFAIVHLLDESVHLHELDVHPDHARQGLGRQLIATVADWARARGAPPLTLVFVSSTAVIKLGPPIWQGEMKREAAALTAVAGQLPIATSTLLAVGTRDSWEYLVRTPLPGANLRALWAELDSAVRAALAYQHGTLMAALHALPLQDIPAHLAFDWQAMLGAQRAECVAEMQRAGVADTLVQQIDWGDVKLGSRMHEFISPGVHMYQGDVEERLVDRDLLDQRRQPVQPLHDLLRGGVIGRKVRGDHEEFRAEPCRLGHGHRRAHPKLPRCVRS